jgi:electron transport complex protein RnfG
MDNKHLKIFYPVFLITMVFIVAVSLIFVAARITQLVLISRQDMEILALLQEIFPDCNLYTYNTKTEIYTTYNSAGREIGYAFYGTGYGYQSEIVILIGLEDKETVKGISIINEDETPDYFYRITISDFLKQFVGLGIKDCYLSYPWLQGGVDVVAGATISSKAIINTVSRSALEKAEYLP